MKNCKCGETINFASARDLCDKCLLSLSKTCIVCGKTFYNVEMLQKCRFLKKKTCKRTCKYDFHRNLMVKNNPMKDRKIAKRVGETQKGIHAKNRQYWRHKYCQSKFQHWINLAEGKENVGGQRNRANQTAIDFFIKMRKEFGWEQDLDYFELHPWEFPLIISKEKCICFFPDYYNKSKNIVIEWDEPNHQKSKKASQDKRRDGIISNKFPETTITRLQENNFASDEERYEFIKRNLKLSNM